MGSGAGVPARPVMVGDRDQDVLGAAATSLACVGVLWGFAFDGELSAAGAAVVVADAPALLVELNARLVQFDAARGGL
ncbi:HAD hydrolase-like protein [Arthrobacter sp. A5]|uniref:HAD hydrolase-like protein n=1 Tax=Arthrobacter sp. A5 TaxID=576926 RepID=UPI003DA7F16D